MSSSIVLLAASGAIAAVSIPLILGVVPPNPIYGFRTRQTLSDEGLWYQANFFAGWALLIAAFVSVVLLVLVRGDSPPAVASEVAAFALPVVVAIVACFVYLRRITGRVAGGRR